MRNAWLLSIIALGIALSVQSAEKVILIKRGGAAEQSMLRLPDNPTPTEIYAAAELDNYVKRATGRCFSSRLNHGVYLERGDKSLGDDAFRLYVKDRSLHIVGGRRGILYGVYEVLERFCGVGWYSPECTVVPRIDAFAVPNDLDETHRPAFKIRDIASGALVRDSAFAAHMRINGFYTWFHKWHGGRNDPYDRWGNTHTFGKMFPLEKYGKTHPEYYALINGKRQVNCDRWHTQLCLTNPDVLAIVTSNVVAEIRADPTRTTHVLEQFDGIGTGEGKGYYCRCPACAALDAQEESHVGSQVWFVNQVADAIERMFPGQGHILEVGAYQYTRKPPKKTRYRPNVRPTLCSIECDFAHPLATGMDPQNVSFREDIKGWRKMADSIRIWDYTTNYHNFPGQHPNFDVLQANLRFFRENGVEDMFEQACHVGHGGEFESLKVWLMAKWEWDTELDEKKLLDQFFAGYYGRAAAPVRRYFEELRALPRPDGKFALRTFHGVMDQTLVSDTFLETAQTYMDEAVALAKADPDPIILENVLKEQFSIDYTRFMRQRGRFVPQKERAIPVMLRRTPPSDIPGAKDFQAMCRRMQAHLESDSTIRFCESRKDEKGYRELIVRGAQGLAPDGDFKPCDSVVVYPETMKVEAAHTLWVDDPATCGGKALRFHNRDYQWAAYLSMPGVMLDSGATYRIRIRAKITLKQDAAPDVSVFIAGIYSNPLNKSLADFKICVRDAKDGEWTTYDLGTWKASDMQFLWLSTGLFDKKKFAENPGVEYTDLDWVEISRADEGCLK